MRKNPFTPTRLCLLMQAALLLPAAAQTAPSDNAADKLDTVVVSGIRASVRKALDIKEASNSMVEVIASEDIGKLPDTTIAESLARLPSLSAGIDRGNASQIVARGLGPRFVGATLNGREFASSEPDRAVRFEMFPSESVSGATVYKTHPGVVTIAEESTSWPGVTRPTHLGGLGFGFKWNMGWMHDTLHYIGRDPIHRSYHHHEMTFSMLYAFSENYVLPISHDEVVHGKGTLWGRMPGNNHVKAAGLRSLLAYQWAHPGKQLLFMGQEFGQRAEWSEERGLDWWQLDEQGFSNGVLRLVGDINGIYQSHPALWSQDTTPEGYSWIDANDSGNNVLSFLRYGKDGSVMACVFNFAGAEHGGYRVGLPLAGRWREVLNTDATAYNGTGIGNMGGVDATEDPWHGRPASALLVLPPTSALWLEPE